MDLFSLSNIDLLADATTREMALSRVADHAVSSGYATSPDGVLAAMIEREGQVTTALMDQIAIPHAKHADITAAGLLVHRLAKPVSWTDGESVKVLVAMLVPEAEAGTTHMRLLARVARALMEDDVRATLAVGDQSAIHTALSAHLAS